MSAPTTAIHDTALARFMKAHRLHDRVASGQPFVAAVGAPAAARRQREGGNVIRLGGYYRLGIRRRGDGELEAGMLHGRRPDLTDAVFLPCGARPLHVAADLRAVCAALVLLIETPSANHRARWPSTSTDGHPLRAGRPRSTTPRLTMLAD